MGKDIYVHVFKYNSETNLYNELKIYTFNENKNEIDNPPPKVIPVYSGRDYKLFDILTNSNPDDYTGYFPNSYININSYTENFKELIKEKEESQCFDFFETSFADVLNYIKDHSIILDKNSYEWNDPDDHPIIDNPVKNFYKNCYNYASLAEKDDPREVLLSQYKIVYYFSW